MSMARRSWDDGLDGKPEGWPDVLLLQGKDRRMRALVLVLSLLIGIPGCGGKKASTNPSRNTARFVNVASIWAFVIEVPSAHQRFELAPNESKIVELVADDGSTEFEFTVTRKGTEYTKTGVVSLGQEVVISRQLEDYSVHVDGEEVPG